MASLAKRIEEFERQIRAGQIGAVIHDLKNISLKGVPRHLRLRLANVCRRTGQFTMGLRILMPLVRDEVATPAELAEYGMLLLRNDLLDEAWKVLGKVDVTRAPEALLFRAFHHFRNWREPDAIPLLERYVKCDLDPYQGVVGRLNLAAAYLGGGELERGSRLIEDLTREAREKSLSRVLGNCLELRAQLEIRRGDWLAARSSLDSSARELESMGTSDALYMRKWRAIVEAHETKSEEPILEFKRRAISSREWESVREADRHRLAVRMDDDVFSHLMFGSPYQRYRASVALETGRNEPTGAFILGSGPRFDFEEGTFAGDTLFKPGSLSLLLLSTLVKDFYRPTRLGTLFTSLYPGDAFDMASSPDRVHQILRRTRRALEAAGVPLSIREVDGDFSIVVDGSLSIAVAYEREAPTRPKLLADRLRAEFGVDRPFDAPTARAKLGIARTTFQRFINEALAAKTVEKIGERNSTRYRLAG